MASLIQLIQNHLSQRDLLLPNETKRVIAKEFLQAYTLDFIYNHSIYRRLNFYGGTCLHLIYGLNRLSEDIDLDNSPGVDLTALENDLLAFFRTSFGYTEVTAKSQTGEWGVHRTTLKFPLLFTLGLSSHTNEPLHLKVEVSQHQQVSIVQLTPLFLAGRSFVASHFSLQTMMAGKMLACLERTFEKGKGGVTVKGRDYYDLLWFMQQKIWPLEEKLARDGRQPYTVRSAMTAVGKKIEKIHLKDLEMDLLPLFEQRSFIDNWLIGFKENFSAYSQYYHSGLPVLK